VQVQVHQKLDLSPTRVSLGLESYKSAVTTYI